MVSSHCRRGPACFEQMYAPCREVSFADWQLLQHCSGAAVFITVPIDSAQGVLGALTVASRGEPLGLGSVNMMAAVLGQCLVHAKCQSDLQVGALCC